MSGHSWAQHEREGWTVCTVCGLVRNYDRPDELEIARLRRERIEQEATNLEMGGEIARLRRELDEARADISVLRDDRDRIRTVSAEALALRDRLSTIVDEAFGPQEVLGVDALLSRLECLLTERARQHEEVRRELAAAREKVAKLRSELDEALAKFENCERYRSYDYRSSVQLTTALRDLIASVEATKTRDTIVLRDLEAARAVLGGQS